MARSGGADLNSRFAGTLGEEKKKERENHIVDMGDSKKEGVKEETMSSGRD